MTTKLSFLVLSVFLLTTACSNDDTETTSTEAENSTIESIAPQITDSLNSASETVSEVVEDAVAEAESSAEAVTEVATETASEVKEQAESMVSDATTVVSEVAEEIKEEVKETVAPVATGGAEHVVNAKGLTAFDKPIIYIAPGDTVHFKKLNGGHNSESVFVPEGAESWAGAMNKNISVTLTVPGFYGYVCLPHAGLGMNGVIVVGDAGDKSVIMDELRALDSKDFSRKLLGKLNKVDPALYVK